MQKNILKDQIVLSCGLHKNQTVISHHRDFDNVPEGGCKEVCNIRMDCGILSTYHY